MKGINWEYLEKNPVSIKIAREKDFNELIDYFIDNNLPILSQTIERRKKRNWSKYSYLFLSKEHSTLLGGTTPCSINTESVSKFIDLVVIDNNNNQISIWM